MILSTYFNKLLSNAANRKDPKFIIVHGDRKDYANYDMQSIKFRELDAMGVKYEKYNSVMMIKHVSKELDKEGIKYFSVERW